MNLSNKKIESDNWQDFVSTLNSVCYLYFYNINTQLLQYDRQFVLNVDPIKFEKKLNYNYRFDGLIKGIYSYSLLDCLKLSGLGDCEFVHIAYYLNGTKINRDENYFNFEEWLDHNQLNELFFPALEKKLIVCRKQQDISIERRVDINVSIGSITQPELTKRIITI